MSTIGRALFCGGALILIWSSVTLLTDWIAPIFFPVRWICYHAFLSMKGRLIPAALASLGITLGGFGIGLVAGIGLGLLMAYSRFFLEAVGPILEFTRPIPVFALIPLFLLWFGVGIVPQILLVALGVAVILGVSTYEAVRNIPPIYIRAAANLGADKSTIFRTVVVPYIIPHIVGAVRVAAAASWGLDVASEFMGAQVGLGYNMIVQQIYLEYFRDHRITYHLQLAGDQSRPSDPANRSPLDPLDLSQRAELRRHWCRPVMETTSPKSGTSGLLSLFRKGVRHAWF